MLFNNNGRPIDAAQAKAAKLKLMAFDVDGVLTDGTLFFTPGGDEIKAFSSLDGHGLKMLMDAGVAVAIITGRSSPMVALRAANLGITHFVQGVSDKRAVMRELREKLGVSAEQSGYIGDDVVDLPVLRDCGFSASVADGHYFVHQHVDYVTKSGGGRGAVRELCDFILTAQGKLDEMLNSYLTR